MAEVPKNTANTGIIILAGGGSSRLGRPKQLLEYNGKTLLALTLETAITSGLQPVVVVLGADAENLRKEINDKEVKLIVNTKWEEGMASSIRHGIKALTETNPNAESVILMVCDQPFVSADLLNNLVAAHEKTRKAVVASGYDNTFGPPVLFHHSLFEELLELKGDIGARSVVRQHVDELEVIPFPEGKFDIDSEADFERIKTEGRQ